MHDTLLAEVMILKMKQSGKELEPLSLMLLRRRHSTSQTSKSGQNGSRTKLFEGSRKASMFHLRAFSERRCAC